MGGLPRKPSQHTIATCSGIVHDDVYSCIICYDSVDDEFDRGVVCNVKGEKLYLWML